MMLPREWTSRSAGWKQRYSGLRGRSSWAHCSAPIRPEEHIYRMCVSRTVDVIVTSSQE
jgi:hypothetical protein